MLLLIKKLMTFNYLFLVLIGFSCIDCKPDLCLNPLNISGIAYINSMRMRWALTKSGYYWLLLKDELPSGDNAKRLPYKFTTGDAIAVKDVYGCENPKDDEFSIVFIELKDHKLQYIAYNIDLGNISEPNDLQKDVIFGKADIDYTQKLDAMFGFGGQIFFIQGDSYAVVFINETCPKTKDSVTAPKARSLQDINIKSPIEDSLIIESESKLYLFKKETVYEILLDTNSLISGILKSVSITQNNIRAFFESNLTFSCKPINTLFPPTDSDDSRTDLMTEYESLSILDDNDMYYMIGFVLILVVIILLWIYFICYGCKGEDKTVPKYEKYLTKTPEDLELLNDETDSRENWTQKTVDSYGKERTLESIESKRQLNLQKFDQKLKSK